MELICVDRSGSRRVNNREAEALVYTFGVAMGRFLIDTIRIRYVPNPPSNAVVRWFIGNKRGYVAPLETSEIQMQSDYDPENLRWLGLFIHEATHIWQAHTWHNIGDWIKPNYDYSAEELDSIDSLGLEQFPSAVQDWFYVNYGLEACLIGKYNEIGDYTQVDTGWVWDRMTKVFTNKYYKRGSGEELEVLQSKINPRYRSVIDRIRKPKLPHVQLSLPDVFAIAEALSLESSFYLEVEPTGEETFEYKITPVQGTPIQGATILGPTISLEVEGIGGGKFGYNVIPIHETTIREPGSSGLQIEGRPTLAGEGPATGVEFIDIWNNWKNWLRGDSQAEFALITADRPDYDASIPSPSEGAQRVNRREAMALAYTFGGQVGSSLIRAIEIEKGSEDLTGSETRMTLPTEYNSERLEWLRIFIRRATRIWQERTRRHTQTGGTEDYQSTQLSSFELLNQKQHSKAVSDWFYVRYGFDRCRIGTDANQLAFATLQDYMRPVLGVGPSVDFSETYLQRFVDIYYARLIEEIRTYG